MTGQNSKKANLSLFGSIAHSVNESLATQYTIQRIEDRLLGFVFSEHILGIFKLVLNIVELSLHRFLLFLCFKFASLLFLAELGDLFFTSSAQLSLR